MPSRELKRVFSLFLAAGEPIREHDRSARKSKALAGVPNRRVGVEHTPVEG
jgi:hypothetical protein